MLCNSISRGWNRLKISTGHKASKTKWLVKILAKSGTIHEGEEKSLSLSLFCWTLSPGVAYLRPAAQWPKAVSVKVWPCWEKVLWGRKAFPFLLHWSLLSSLSFTTAGASRSCCCQAHGFTQHLKSLVPKSSPCYQCQLGRELQVKLKLSWTDLNFTMF